VLESLRANERLARLAGTVMVAAMMACVMVTIVQLLEVIFPGWNGNMLIVVAFFLALEAMNLQRSRRERSFPDLDWFVFYITEWVVILLILKIVMLAGQGSAAILDELSGYRVHFWESFFNTGYLISALAIVVIWFLAIAFADAMTDLSGDENWLKIEEDSGVYIERYGVRKRLANLIIIVGAVMILSTVLLRLNLNLRWFQIPQVRLGVVNILIYFILGFSLLSLTQFAILRIRWLRSGFQMSPHLARLWVIYSLIFLSGLVVIAFLLPTGYTLNLLSLLNLGLKLITSLVGIIFWLVTLPIAILSYLLGLLLGRPAEMERPSEFVPLTPPVEPSPVNEAYPWIEIAKSFGFWLIFVGLIIYSVYYVINNRKAQFRYIRGSKIFVWLGELWRAIKSRLLGINRLVVSAVRTGIGRLREQSSNLVPRNSWRYIGIRKKSAREQVRFYYLTMEMKARESGFPRKESQTPNEYVENFITDLHNQQDTGAGSEAPEEELEALTQQFMLARYSLHVIPEEMAELGKSYWSHIRRYLRKVKGNVQ
jgi:hypothetical protein